MSEYTLAKHGAKEYGDVVVCFYDDDNSSWSYISDIEKTSIPDYQHYDIICGAKKLIKSKLEQIIINVKKY